MYVPSLFREDDPAVLRSLMAAHPFATIITTPERPRAEPVVLNHLPLLWQPRREHGVLRGHMARANPQWRTFAASEVLAIFHGPDAYVSPRWYRPGAQVPTWNYAVVHVRGTARILEEPLAALALLEEQVAFFEASLPDPWSLADGTMEHDELMDLVGAIVAFEIEVSTLTGKLKLSQNREPADRAGVIRALQASEDPRDRAVARLMRP